ncbi:class I SAM-dependent DNA methyltransferase [Streptomyces olivochromogenes]|uniref:class I SAM-dependent DNA methyltransferase n=1 Tax=Streptomyces olivochromogenes TaxID=1963 RepID=UPI001F1A4E68|nr:class I SAM-dependent methyltransferase [Streptomyces olivochromogenes]MCF3130044.1 class I SAM-dependent methyltransferase [Streptomyces olivochromogenes]
MRSPKGRLFVNSPNGRQGYGDLRIDRTGQAEAFDVIGDRYDEAFPHKDGQIAATDWLVKSLPAGSRVLDLGCGTGLPTSRQLAQAGFQVVGVDLSGGMLALARENVPGAEFHQMDIADLRPGGPRDLGRFDAVTAFFSLLMLPRAEIPLALDTIAHLLTPGGLFALSMVEADVDDFGIPFIGSTIRVSGYLREDLCAVVEAGGFGIVDESSYTYAPASLDVQPEEQIFLRCRRKRDT